MNYPSGQWSTYALASDNLKKRIFAYGRYSGNKALYLVDNVNSFCRKGSSVGALTIRDNTIYEETFEIRRIFDHPKYEGFGHEYDISVIELGKVPLLILNHL